MKLVFCISIVCALLILCSGKPRTPAQPSNRYPYTTKGYPYTTKGYPYTTKGYPYTTKGYPYTTTRYPDTTAGTAMDLSGKMFTLNVSSEVIFYPSNQPTTTSQPIKPTTEPTLRPATMARAKTATRPIPWPTTTPPPRPTTRRPSVSGVTVCLRYIVDDVPFELFTLAPNSGPEALSLSVRDQRYTLSWGGYDRYQVSLSTSFFIWNLNQNLPWRSVCLVVDSHKNVIQVFEDLMMSIRKIPPSRIILSKLPQLKVSGFDGQVTDIQVWDYPVENEQILRFMQGYRTWGTLVTWSSLVFGTRGPVLLEDSYTTRPRKPIGHSNGAGQPIGLGRVRRIHYKKEMFKGWRRRKSPVL